MEESLDNAKEKKEGRGNCTAAVRVSQLKLLGKTTFLSIVK
jgi:hypothetical protein